MTTSSYHLTFAGVPFLLDQAAVVRMHQPRAENDPQAEILPARKHQPLADLVDELNRLLPSLYLQDFSPPPSPGRNLAAIAYRSQAGPWPNPQVRIGDWFYPTMASRWSIFRGLASSTMVKEMLRLTGGTIPKTLSMKCVPEGARNDRQTIPPNLVNLLPARGSVDDQYTVATEMYMLPPRPLGELGGRFDGLYLVTLVDERYYWQHSSVTLRVTHTTTWQSLIDQCVTALGITGDMTIDIPAVYSRPEPDSQLWANEENAALLLDAVAHNIGDVVIRYLTGTTANPGRFRLIHAQESQGVVRLNRGEAATFLSTGVSVPGRNTTRTAGGSMFQRGTKFPVGDLQNARNAVVPSSVRVTFPRYVRGDDPVPHFVNSRTTNQRPTCWFEDSYGSVYNVDVPIASGNSLFAGNLFHTDPSPVSGLVGTTAFTHTIQTTAKALYSTEAAATGHPVNQDDLTSLAMQLAADYYDWQGSAALDEVYPGIYNWIPEGFHDIVWTYSARSRQACTRVLRAPWNAVVEHMQHAAPATAVTLTTVPKGVGGPSVPQTWLGGNPLAHTTTLASPLASGAIQAILTSPNNFPGGNRWRATVGAEALLFEGVSGQTTVDIVHRGIDGTAQAAQATGATVTMTNPQAQYGVNLIRLGRMQFAYPTDWTSGGVTSVAVIPQTQSVSCLSITPQAINGINHYSGRVLAYNPGTGIQFPGHEYVWLVERNAQLPVLGRVYDGQFAGWSAVPHAGIYLVNNNPPPSCGCFRYLDDVSVAVGVVCVNGVITATTNVTKTFRWYNPLSGCTQATPC